MFIKGAPGILALCAQSATALVHNALEIREDLQTFKDKRSTMTNLPDLETLHKADAVVRLADVDLPFIKEEIENLQTLQMEIEKQLTYFFESPYEKWRKLLGLQDHYIYLPLKEEGITTMDFVSDTEAKKKIVFGKLHIAIPDATNTPKFERHLPRVIQLLFIYIRMMDMKAKQLDPIYHVTHYEAPLYQAAMFTWIEILRILEKKYKDRVSFIDEIEEAKCTGKCKYLDKQELRQVYWQIELAHTSEPARLKDMKQMEELRKAKEKIVFPKGVPESLKRPNEAFITPESYILVKLKLKYKNQASKNFENEALWKKCGIKKENDKYVPQCWNMAMSFIKGPKIKQLLTAPSQVHKKKPTLDLEDEINIGKSGKLRAAPPSLVNSPNMSLQKLLELSEEQMPDSPDTIQRDGKKEDGDLSDQSEVHDISPVYARPHNAEKARRSSFSEALTQRDRQKEDDGVDDLLQIYDTPVYARPHNEKARRSSLKDALLQNNKNLDKVDEKTTQFQNNVRRLQSRKSVDIPRPLNNLQTLVGSLTRASPNSEPATGGVDRLRLVDKVNVPMTRVLPLSPNTERIRKVIRGDHSRSTSIVVPPPSDEIIINPIQEVDGEETPSTVNRPASNLMLPEIKYTGKERDVDSRIRQSFKILTKSPKPMYRRSVDMSEAERKLMLDRMIKDGFKLTPRGTHIDYRRKSGDDGTRSNR